MESTRPVNRAICHELTKPATAPITAATAVRSSTISKTSPQPNEPIRSTGVLHRLTHFTASLACSRRCFAPRVAAMRRSPDRVFCSHTGAALCAPTCAAPHRAPVRRFAAPIGCAALCITRCSTVCFTCWNARSRKVVSSLPQNSAQYVHPSGAQPAARIPARRKGSPGSSTCCVVGGRSQGRGDLFRSVRALVLQREVAFPIAPVRL